MTTEEEITELNEEVCTWRLKAFCALREVDKLNGDIRRFRLVEEELRGIIADREDKTRWFKEEAKKNEEWVAHSSITNDCNRRMAEAMERLVDEIKAQYKNKG